MENVCCMFAIFFLFLSTCILKFFYLPPPPIPILAHLNLPLESQSCSLTFSLNSYVAGIHVSFKSFFSQIPLEMEVEIEKKQDQAFYYEVVTQVDKSLNRGVLFSYLSIMIIEKASFTNKILPQSICSNSFTAIHYNNDLQTNDRIIESKI